MPQRHDPGPPLPRLRVRLALGMCGYPSPFKLPTDQ